MAKVTFEKVRKKFKDVVVIKGLDLTIEDGEFFTFVGTSGCGKSTVLNLVAGLEPVTGGTIYFDDNPVNDLSPKARDVAMVFQSYALYPHMTVSDNIAFPLKMRKFSKEIIDEEVKRIAPILGLEGLLDRKPRALSGGQRQRVALGRAIIRKPKVFLLDEPLSNLDARLRIDMRAELKRLHQALKITTIYVTHDQAEAMSLSDRIAVLHQGVIQQCGIPVEIYSKPEDTFVAGFIGSPPINFIPAFIRNHEPLEIECNGLIFSPQNHLLSALPKDGKEKVLVGVRPEDVLVYGEASEGTIRVLVSLIEPAGSFNWVDFMWGGVKVKGTSKVHEGLKAGSQAFMRFPRDKVILFNRTTGKRL